MWFKLRGPSLVNAEPGGYLGWLRDLDRMGLRGAGSYLRGSRASVLGRVVNEQRQGRLNLSEHAARFKSCPRNPQTLSMHLQKPLSQTFKICGIITPHERGVIDADKRQRDHRYRMAVRA